MKTHQINVTPGEYAAIVKYDEPDYVQLLRPASEKYTVGDVLHLREFAPGWGIGRNCYRKVASVVTSPRAVDAQAGPMVGLSLNIYFGEGVGLGVTAEFKEAPRAIEVEHLAEAA